MFELMEKKNQFAISRLYWRNINPYRTVQIQDQIASSVQADLRSSLYAKDHWVVLSSLSIKLLLGRVENILGKGRNAGYQSKSKALAVDKIKLM